MVLFDNLYIMKLLLSIGCLILLFSCNNKNRENLHNGAESVVSIDESSDLVIQGTEIALDVVIHPNRMGIGNGILFISCFKCDTMIYTFALPSLKLLSSFARKGEGPDDFLFPVFCGSKNNLVSVWGLSNLRIIKQFQVTNQGDWVFKKGFELKDNKAYNQPYLLRDSFLFYNEFPPQLSVERVYLYDLSKTKQLKFDKDKEITESFFQMNKGDLLASDSGIAYLYYYKNRIDFYDFDLNIIKSHSNKESSVRVNRQNYNESLVYYVNSYAGNKFLYALKRGKPLSLLMDSSFDCMEIYDWKGNMVTEFKLNPTPDLFVVDEMNSIIYGCNYNYPDYIFRYDINDVYNY